MSDHIDTLDGIPALMWTAQRLLSDKTGRVKRDVVEAATTTDWVSSAIKQRLLVCDDLFPAKYVYPSKRGWTLVHRLNQIPAIPPHFYLKVASKAGYLF
jgi:hypothetical protein